MNIEQAQIIYEISPLQEAVLLDSLYSQDSSKYCGQLICELSGILNVATLEKALQLVVDNYPVLRTFFDVEHFDRPRQAICEQVRLVMEKQEWRCFSLDLQQEQLEIFLQADRVQGFDPSKAPLIRLTLCQISEDVHKLVCTYHPLLLDSLSLHLILKQVLAYYEELSQGRELQLELSRPYQDYITWLEQQDVSKAEVFWRRMLEGFILPTSLKVTQMSSRSVGKEKKYVRQQLTISAVTTTKLQSLTREHQLGLDTILHGAWAVLLSRYSREENVVFGTTLSGRPADLSGSESMVGSFMNILPIAVSVRQNTPVLSWLQELQDQQAALHQYDYSSLVQIGRWSDLPGGMPLFETSVTLVFETSVTLENSSITDDLQEQTGSLHVRNIETFGPINFPITLKARLNPELRLQITYDCDRFDRSTITRMLGHLQTLLEGIVMQPKQSLSTLPLLTKPERQQLLIEWNDTNTEYPQERCIHQLFEAQVEQTPDAALIFEDKQLTYRQLNSRANQLANYLQALGVGPEIPVVICMERSLEMVVGLVGILKAGSAYVPMDPAYPFERLSFILEDVQPPVLLTQETLLESLPSHWAQVVCLDSDWEVIAQESDENPSSGVTANNLAYIIHTSGSTGTPKGVLVEHRGLCNLAKAQIRIFDVKTDSRILQFASLSFDASIWEIVMALCSGARLCLGTLSSLLPGPDLMQLLRDQAITHVTLPPSALATLPTEKLPALQTIIVAGEACGTDLVAKWATHRRFFNAYGPTEATVCATVAECTNSSSQPSIGHPIANTQAYILDHHLQLLPVGVPGELFIGGAGLARGYLHRSDLTAEKFIPNPLSNQPGERLYRTGDLACYRCDGTIEYLGRIDFQVKIRGFRIELGEIETVLSQYPTVQQTAVIAREDVPGEKQIVAYIVPTQEQTSTVSELRNFLLEKLPGYMVPTSFVMLDALPLTPNGKVNRQALPPPSTLRPELEATYVMPQSEVERTIATVWQKELSIKKVGIHDNFFEIGGNSLLMFKVHSQLSQILQTDLSMLDLFRYTTINSLAEYLNLADTTSVVVDETGDRTKKLTSGKAKLKQRLQKNTIRSEM